MVQGYLVNEYEINPWKLFGFSMYCTIFEFNTAAVDKTAGDDVLLDEKNLGKKAAAIYGRFWHQRYVLGDFIDPTPVAVALFKDRPGMNVLNFSIMRGILVGKNIETTEKAFTFDRANMVKHGLLD